MSVSGHSKTTTKGRTKLSRFWGSIEHPAAWAAPARDERTRRELAAFDFIFVGQWLVQSEDCMSTGH